MTVGELIADLVARLDEAAIPHMVTGSIASSWYGEPRATMDLDVVIDPSVKGLDHLVGSFQTDHWYVDRDVALAALQDRTQFNAIGPEASKVDLIVRHDRPFSVAEFRRRQPAELLGTSTFVPTVEDMVVAKLEWAKQTDFERQLRDVEGMLEMTGGSVDRAYIEDWVERLGLETAWAKVQT